MLCCVLSAQLLVSTALQAAPLTGKAIAQQGNGGGAPPCMSCHGDKGQGIPAAGYPFLAGQSAVYLAKQLEDFSKHRRNNAVMQPIASALTAEQIKSVSQYYSKLPVAETAAVHKDGVQRALGEVLANDGKWAVGMPACFQCHGAEGQGIAPHFPAISGQSAMYLKAQLERWQKGERTNDAVGLMQAVVEHLDDSEITALADYLAAQPMRTKK